MRNWLKWGLIAVPFTALVAYMTPQLGVKGAWNTIVVMAICLPVGIHLRKKIVGR